jgi:hypothetical protein
VYKNPKRTTRALLLSAYSVQHAYQRARQDEERQLRELEEAERQEEEERRLAEEETERQWVEAEERRLAAEREEERRETERIQRAEEERRATEASGSGAGMVIDMDTPIESLGKARCFACVKKGTQACVRQ